MNDIVIRMAELEDLQAIKTIYNEGIEDRIATLETELKDEAFMNDWFERHQGRFKVFVAELNNEVIGWASLNSYNSRCAYNGVADLSLYIARAYRGKGVGNTLLQAIENAAKNNDFHKIVLSTFPFNQLGQGLYRKRGFREVGVFVNQGVLDGQYVDVMMMEKLLS
ncbi:arsinothricin resistance N-acetyltransferase ArsN1 family A [Bacillus sp. PS06]|uniref:arsinothricin resistance N-acetyltransferase ArsN1 family A n=1 Tax=Bacillus sp. PS06 TaxID=2764176 RepID=UPI0017868850|nr:arsinothricin resistance N-acetyltransferase ArsN1 family A [Bacillus sp. PS06]MBD8071445.1 N-acetyltransferase [Bacillus sp. PS06]